MKLRMFNGIIDSDRHADQRRAKIKTNSDVLTPHPPEIKMHRLVALPK
jgi:hypothetical protein